MADAQSLVTVIRNAVQRHRNTRSTEDVDNDFQSVVGTTRRALRHSEPKGKKHGSLVRLVHFWAVLTTKSHFAKNIT